MSALFLFIICILFLLCVFFAWYFYNKSKHEERKLLIQQGMNVRDAFPKDRMFKTFWLKLGVLVLGLSIGLIIISVLVNLNMIGRSDAIYPAILGVCGGGALVISHHMENNKKSK